MALLAVLPVSFALFDGVFKFADWRWSLRSGFSVAISSPCGGDGRHVTYAGCLVRKDGLILKMDTDRGRECECGKIPCDLVGYLVRADAPDRIEYRPNARFGGHRFELADAHETFLTYYAREGKIPEYARWVHSILRGKEHD